MIADAQGIQGFADKPVAGMVFLRSPVRFLDTRSSGASSFAYNLPATPLSVDTDTLYNARINVIPNTARGIFGNITCVNNSGNGFLTVYPNSIDLRLDWSTPTKPVQNRPFVSTTNYRTSGNPNQFFCIALGPDGKFWIFNASTGTSVDVIIDFIGYVV